MVTQERLVTRHTVRTEPGTLRNGLGFGSLQDLVELRGVRDFRGCIGELGMQGAKVVCKAEGLWLY